MTIATAKFDLTLELTETPDGLSGFLEYDSDLFEAATMDRLVGIFLRCSRPLPTRNAAARAALSTIG